ncbi:hypothetical protein [Paenibacillus eucommiae]|uniref:TM2 domain-containing membrane protein YozV n=1 Tax=Paenibacillus eucommiae TaxID=1355755 RepID=A0ABS4IYB4_9BACL|nr:hypothetical protein [Paenibacillus eucommiae]MBP1992568.1 TM2 domain-containing membrane protein YozV [Paenibacillus eucommiae]
MNKNALLAFLLSFIPGAGHLYLGRKVRAFFYAAGFFGPIMLILLIVSMTNGLGRDAGYFLIAVSLAFAAFNMIDMIITLLSPTSSFNRRPAVYPQHTSQDGGTHTGYGEPNKPNNPYNPYNAYSDPLPADSYAEANRQQNERFLTILLSFIPGLGHFQIGLMHRGLAFLISFFGLITMVFFVSQVTRVEGFFVFLFALPVIILYSVFDAVQLLHRKQRGEELVDRTIFEELEQSREEGRKSKIIAMLLSVFPGAGHMYLGLQRRGLQIMAAFLFAIYIMDVLRLSIFLFVIPILWFYSLFDAMQLVSKGREEELKDIPVINWLLHNQKWLGIALLAIGSYYLIDQMLLKVLERMVPEWRLTMWFHEYLQIFIVSTLFIGAGLRMLIGGGTAKKDGGSS